mgnify:CR=1 FL=1
MLKTIILTDRWTSLLPKRLLCAVKTGIPLALGYLTIQNNYNEIINLCGVLTSIYTYNFMPNDIDHYVFGVVFHNRMLLSASDQLNWRKHNLSKS